MRSAAKITTSLVFLLGLTLQAQTNAPDLTGAGNNEATQAQPGAAAAPGAAGREAMPAAGKPQDPTKTHDDEVIRRQEKSEEMHKMLLEAQDAQKRNQIAQAAADYQTAANDIPYVEVGNPAVDLEKKAVIAGLDAIEKKLAEDAMKDDNLAEASQHITIALQHDPGNPQLRTLKIEIDQKIADNVGKEPSAETQKYIPIVESNRVTVAELVQDGKLLYELGQYDDAEAKLKQVLERDPSNTAAPYYMDLLQEARYNDAARNREIGTKRELLDVEREWLKERKDEKLPAPNPYVTNTLVYTSPGRQSILHKLQTIPFELDFDQPIPLGDVLRVLKDESKKRDVEQKGINFGYNPNAGGSPAAAGADAALALAAPAAGTPVDMQDIHVKISPPLDNLTLFDALDAICKVASLPPGASGGGLTYSIEDYAIYFFVKPPEAVPLYTRTFHVDPNTFIQGLENVSSAIIAGSGGETGGGNGGGGGFGGGGFGGGGFGGGGFGGGGFGGGGYGGGGYGGGGYGGGGYGGGGGGGGAAGASSGSVSYPIVNLAGSTGGGGGRGGAGGGTNGGGLQYVTTQVNTTNASFIVRMYFSTFGVNLLTNGAFVFFNDRAGEILARATEHDLDTMAQAIELLNKYPPQVTIDTKFASVTQTDNKGIGFQAWLGNITTANGAIGAEPGTAPSYTGKPTLANPSGIFPSSASPIAPAASDGNITAGLENTYGTQAASMPTLATVTGILTDPQFRLAIQAIQQRNGSDLLSAPRVTTLSTRQAHVAVQDIVDIVTSVELGETSSTGVTGTTGVGGLTGGAAIAASSSYETTPFVEGPALDVMPTVSADGFSIQMVLIPTYTEFVGYDPPGAFVPQATTVSSSAVGIPITAVLPLPHYRVRQAVTSVNVWDGQTVMLGGLISETITKQKDEVPVLGDLPIFGRFFRDETSTSSKENLLIFVTPTIIDPAGNRVHREDMSDMPYARTSIPPQPARNP